MIDNSKRLSQDINQSQKSGSAQTIQVESSTNPQFAESRYRWIILLLTTLCLFLNSIANNAIIPIQSKMTKLYETSTLAVSASVNIIFLAFSVVNIPANHLIDTLGLRFSFLLGTGLITLGLFMCTFIEYGYAFAIVGAGLIGVGQPFILNSPAKVATFWFFPKNRMFITAILVGINLFGSGIGFLIPALVVSSDFSFEDARLEVKVLYISYFSFALVCFILSCVFMRTKPKISPSGGAEAEKLSFTKSLFLIKADTNLWKFFLAFFLCYGTFLSFGASANFIMKPYGYSDIQIAINAVFLLIFGTVGAILTSLYVKRSNNYKLVLRFLSMSSTISMGLMVLWLNTLNIKIGTTILISVIGFVLAPLVPTCYDLGCELSFPIGQAQVTGLLNGGSFFWAFVTNALMVSLFGYDSTQDSLKIMLSMAFLIMSGCLLYFQVKILLKRRIYETTIACPAASSAHSIVVLDEKQI